MRDEPLRIEAYLTRDYINRAVKMREIEQRVARDTKMRGWRLVMVWALVIGWSVGVWGLIWQEWFRN